MSSAVQRSKKIIVGLLVLTMFIIVWFSGIKDYINFEYIKSNCQAIKLLCDQNYALSVATYISLYILVVLCCLPGVALMSIIGGFLYGIFPGVLYILFAGTISAVIFFLMVRYVCGTFFQSIISRKMPQFNTLLKQRGWFFLLMARFMPLIPFFVVNIGAALAPVTLRTFAWTTIAGMIPSALIFSYTGKQLTSLTCWADILSGKMLLVYGFLIVLLVVPMVLRRYYFTGQRGASVPTPR